MNEIGNNRLQLSDNLLLHTDNETQFLKVTEVRF